MRVENRVHAKRACAIGLMHSASEDVRALPNALRSSDDVAKRQCDVWETWEYQNGPNKGKALFYRDERRLTQNPCFAAHLSSCGPHMAYNLRSLTVVV
ncbi:hypothetical protein RB195_011234 [Necator americanus]|uniref:Uncharacterized protein n=1 Tax=Necator americanus TaxID=51031 RepID=A0ABR1D1I6_NECAM